MKRILTTTAILILTTFSAATAFAQQPLYGEWDLVKITKDGKDVPVVPARKTPSIKFDKESSAAGSGGCNGYSGSYTTQGGKINFGPIRATKMGCAPEINRQEILFFELLNKTDRYKMSGGRLVLSDEAGTNALHFVSLAPPQIADDVKPVEPPTKPDERPFLWIVDKKKVDCRGIVRQNCLQVKKTDAAEWEILRDKIAGFRYKPGKYYLIRVKRTAAGYKLVKIISRTRLMAHVD